MHKRPFRGHCAPALAVNPANRAAPAACALGDLHSKRAQYIRLSSGEEHLAEERDEMARRLGERAVLEPGDDRVRRDLRIHELLIGEVAVREQRPRRNSLQRPCPRSLPGQKLQYVIHLCFLRL